MYIDDLEHIAVETLEVLELLGDVSEHGKRIWLTTPKGSLAIPAREGESNGTPRTPLEVLLAGDFEAVKKAASGYAETIRP
jgi:hypothetical protein